MSKEEIGVGIKGKDWRAKISSAKTDTSQGAVMFMVLGFIVFLVGILLSVMLNSIFMIFAGAAVGMLFVGVSYILRALEVIIYNLYDQTKNGGSENDGKN